MTEKGVLWSYRDPDHRLEDGIRIIASDLGGGVWAADLFGRYRIRRIGGDGELSRTLEPKRNWFLDWRTSKEIADPNAPHGSRSSPQARVLDLLVDSGRLWVLGSTVDRRWERARHDGYYDVGLSSDNIVEVFDIESGALLASARVDLDASLWMAFAGPGRVWAAETYEVSNRISVWEIEFTDLAAVDSDIR